MPAVDDSFGDNAAAAEREELVRRADVRVSHVPFGVRVGVSRLVNQGALGRVLRDPHHAYPLKRLQRVAARKSEADLPVE